MGVINLDTINSIDSKKIEIQLKFEDQLIMLSPKVCLAARMSIHGWPKAWLVPNVYHHHYSTYPVTII
jgi:hypothetical protein